MGALGQVPPTNQISSPSERQAHWRQDLEALATALRVPGIRIAGGIATRGQKDFAEVYPNFDSEIASLGEAVPNLTDSEMLLRLMLLIASAHIAHNTVDIPLGMGFLTRLPLEFHWFVDGLLVTGATSEYSGLLGARVLNIGGKTPEQFLADLAPYISYENEQWLRAQSINLMPASGVLQHFGMLDTNRSVHLRLEKRGGELTDTQIPVAPGNAKKIDIREGLQIPQAVYSSHPGEWYWFRYLQDSQTLFIQYNRCANDSQHRFDDFARQVLVAADSNFVKHVVIDLRWNGGGDSSVINPLKNGLASRLRRPLKVMVLIGPGTFSSALDNAAELHKSLSATLVGEPSGGTTDGYGELSSVILPNSRLVIRFTTKRWGPKGSSAAASTLTPEIAVPFKSVDFIAGRDPALEAAIAARL
jgi:hypothetical protein